MLIKALVLLLLKYCGFGGFSVSIAVTIRIIRNVPIAEALKEGAWPDKEVNIVPFGYSMLQA